MKTAWFGSNPSTPVGNVWAAFSEYGLVAVDITSDRQRFMRLVESLGFDQVLEEFERVAIALDQLDEYLRGQRQVFELPIDWSVLTPFQDEALRLTCAIPYGCTSTYKSIAVQLQRPKAARAVGRAEATNPMPLVIPCHRVLGSDGGLHGYGTGNGLETKHWLLQLEKSHSQKS